MLLTVILKTVAALLAAFAALVLYQWLRLRRLRRRATTTDVGAWVGTLLRGFAPGAVLIAEPNGKRGFIQFALTQRHQEWRTLEFGLPDTEWSRTAMQSIQDLLDAAGVGWTIEAGTNGEPVQRFLRAELAGERAQVLQRARHLIPGIAAALGHPVNQTYHIHLIGHDAPEYRQELATKLENLPEGGRFERGLAEVVRGRSDRK